MRGLQSNRIAAPPLEWKTRLFWAVVWIVVLVFVAPRLVVGAEPQTWRTDFDAALREAEEKKLPLLMHFHADWCMPCQKMEQTVFNSSAVREMLAPRFVAVKLNSEKNQHLVRRYGFEILPTDIALDPLTGRVLTIHSGYLDQAAYIKLAQQSEARFRHLHTPAANPANPEGGTGGPAVPRPGAGPELGDPVPVVGLDGYSPVAIVKSRQWTRGSAQYAWDYKGVLFQMSSREELLEFRKSPETYAPKFLGCDPVILWETDRAVAGSADFGAFYDDELYLFKTEERRKQFKANPQKFTKLQQAVKADQIERTAMR
jgi:thioredoxin-related protein/YHS domain-containing protein